MMHHDLKPLISVIMPVRNTEAFLEECLDSILHQTESHWELVCINNQSEDRSLEILRKYAQKDQRIKVLENTNSDLIKALRLAYSHCSGTIITRMDSDDIMPVTRLETMRNLLETHGPKTVVTGKVMYFSEDGVLGAGFKRYEQWLNTLSATHSNFSQVYKECVIPSPCWMVWKEDLDLCGSYTPDTYPEDYDLCFRFYKNRLNVVAAREVMLHWRDYGHRNSRTDPNYADQLFFDLKLKYFFETDYNPNKTLAVWGAGRKGKLLVQKLQKITPDLDWVTDSPNKTGHNIYHIILKHPTELSSDHQVLIAVSNDDQQNLIAKELTQKGIEHFRFC